MKPFFIALLFLASCSGGKGDQVTLTVAGVTMADLESVKAELAKIDGVADVQSSGMKDGQATLTLRYAKGGADLAGRLAKSPSGLKNVKGFDGGSIQVSYDGAAAPVVAAKPPEPKPADVKPAEPKPDDQGKEVKVDAKKDPLSYKVHQLPAGTLATFDGWKVALVSSDSTWATLQSCPEGKEMEFMLYITAGTPDAQTVANYFDFASQYIHQQMPMFQTVGRREPTKFGGDDAQIENLSGEAQGKKLVARAVYIRKKDVCVGVMGIGTEAAFKEYGRSIEITAQSITVKESGLDPKLVGTWTMEKYYSSGAGTSNKFSSSSSNYVTIFPNGTFTENSHTYASTDNSSGQGSVMAEGGNRGRIVLRGNMMTMHYDNGKTWTGEWKFDGGGSALWLNKSMYLKQ